MPEKKGPTDRIFTIPNLISLARIFIIPFFLWLLISSKPVAALAVFTAAALTDLLDGLAARLLRQKSKLGALLDPAGDKLLMTAALIGLSLPSLDLPNLIPLWLTVIIIARDLFIVGSALFLYKTQGQSSFPPTFLGKLTTFTQMSVLVLVLLCNAANKTALILNWTYVLAAGLTILSWLQYGYIGLKLRKISFKRSDQ
ncbi:MAG: CDP-alcohol phosphatidyltransferase family protein [Candidatus Aminicenantes bacterium]|nr:CDP-alcohol phosphatidyltransferase family protein [Candidatus Aminicenantes bacterium]